MHLVDYLPCLIEGDFDEDASFSDDDEVGDLPGVVVAPESAGDFDWWNAHATFSFGLEP